MSNLFISVVQRLGSIAILAFVLILTACTTTDSPTGAEDARNKLDALQRDADLVGYAPVEFREAEQAVRLAETGGSEEELRVHRVYVAQRKVDIAEAVATTRRAEDQREQLVKMRDEIRLKARTREADQAHRKTERAQEQARQARMAQEQTEGRAAELEQQLVDLEAKSTERGIVLTLGDVLFATNSAELRGGANRNLDKLVDFLDEYPDRSAIIEGHTDNTGSAEYNLGLSQKRAEAVRSYLVEKGVERERLTVEGIGQERPVASNDSSEGRQQNRRVEIIVEHAES